MMLARVCRATISPQVTSLLKAPIVPRINKFQPKRFYSSNGGSSYARTAARAEAESFSPPLKGTAINIGKGFAAGAGALGLGALCYYGAGLSSATGAIDHAAFWPEYVKERLQTTYMYFGGSMAISTAVAAACLRSPAVMGVLSSTSLLAFGISLAAMIGVSMLVRSLPYKEGFGAKQMAWMLHAGTVGAIIAPMSLYGGPLLLKAALYTAGIVGGLSAVAVCAPSDKFLNIGGPLGMMSGAMFATCIGGMFLPPSTLPTVYSIVVYGGLVLFGVFLLYDTQRVIRDAETCPVAYRKHQGNAVKVFDPINHAVKIYMDVVNIFIRIAEILHQNQKRK